MKSALKILAVILPAAFIFASCAKLPDKPVTSTVVDVSYIDPVSQTYPVPENADPGDISSSTVRYVAGDVSIKCVLNSYYVDGKSTAKVNGITVSKQPGQYLASGNLEVRMDSIGSRKDGMRIDYTCYDAQGNAISEDLSTRAPLEDVEEGDIIYMPVTVMPGTVKIVFNNYNPK